MSEAKRTALVERLLHSVPGVPEDLSDWVSDADWARMQQEPLRARRLLWFTLLCVILLIVWAGLAQLEEVTRGEGRVIPSSQLQIVQAVDGGVIESIMVREGAQVEPGQLLMRIDPTRFVSTLRENQSKYLSLQARAARLEALVNERPFEPAAAWIEQAPEIVENERLALLSLNAERQAQTAAARDQVEQREREIQQARARRDQAKRSLELVERELSMTRPLIRNGAVSEVEVLRLERDRSRVKGDKEQAIAQILQAQAALTQSRNRLEEVELNLVNGWRAELAETLAELGSLGESSRALADRVDKSVIRSPVRGTINRVLLNTVGAVAQPGTELFEIVPLDDALVLETRIKPKDIAFLRPQLPATVKFTAYDFAIYGGLKAVVEQIGADSLVDDAGDAYFIVIVRTEQAALGVGLPIIPGMLAEVDIITGKKSVLDYLLKPVHRARARALSER